MKTKISRTKLNQRIKLPYINSKKNLMKSKSQATSISKNNYKKIKRFKKKKKKFSKLTDLVPINLDEEKRKFFEQDCNYNPQFIYNSENIKFKIPNPDSKYLSLAMKIINNVINRYGSDSGFFKSFGKRVTIDEFKQGFADYVNEQDLAEITKLKFTTTNLSNARFSYSKKSGSCTIVIGVPLYVRKDGIKDLLNHEIGTHFLRKLNEKYQPLFKKKRKLRLNDPLEFEEGLACLNSKYESALHSKAPPYLFSTALRYVFGYYASTLSFADLFKFIAKYIVDPGKCWKECLRVKRGVKDTSIPGGMYKDQVYFKGAVEILMKRKEIDFELLYGAKINFKDYKRLKDHIFRSRIKLPYFLKDIEKYHQALDRIAKVNFIN